MNKENNSVYVKTLKRLSRLTIIPIFMGWAHVIPFISFLQQKKLPSL